MAPGEGSLERILSPEYLDGLAAIQISELRRRRTECQELEVALSYVRRLAQGRLDIVHADLERRAGGQASDLSELVEQLPEILSQQMAGPDRGHLPVYLSPGVGQLASRLDAVAPTERLAELSDLSDAEVRALASALEDQERALSADRKELHSRIDRIQAEIVDRYKSGRADVGHLFS